MDSAGRTDRTFAVFLEAVADSNRHKDAIGADIDHILDHVARPPGDPKRRAEVVRITGPAAALSVLRAYGGRPLVPVRGPGVAANIALSLCRRAIAPCYWTSRAM